MAIKVHLVQNRVISFNFFLLFYAILYSNFKLYYQIMYKSRKFAFEKNEPKSPLGLAPLLIFTVIK